MTVVVLGIDLAKHVFQLHGVDAHGRAVVAKRVSRAKLAATVAQLAPQVMAMEACCGAGYRARRLSRKLGAGRTSATGCSACSGRRSMAALAAAGRGRPVRAGAKGGEEYPTMPRQLVFRVGPLITSPALTEPLLLAATEIDHIGAGPLRSDRLPGVPGCTPGALPGGDHLAEQYHLLALALLQRLLSELPGRG